MTKIINSDFIILTANELVFIISILHILFYLVLIKFILHRYSKHIQQSFSNINNINLKWLKSFTNSFCFIFLLMGLFFLLYNFKIPFSILQRLIPVIPGILFYALAYRSIKQPDFYINSQLDIKSNKYEKSSLSSLESKKLYHKLLILLAREKPFLNHNLTLLNLSEMINIPIRQ